MAIPIDFSPNSEKINFEFLACKNINISMLRLDQSDSIISGNKWYKLKYNFKTAVAENHTQLISFGGAHSNHLLAFAHAAQIYNLRAIGIVRGLHDLNQETLTMKACKAFGMQVKYITQLEYQQKNEHQFLEKLQLKWGNSFVIPEGGANELGRKGCEEIAQFIPVETTHVCISVGTGTTFSGIVNALPNTIKIIGFAPMKGGKYLIEELIKVIQKEKNNWEIVDDFHFGGFGKIKPALIEFIKNFQTQYHIILDPVYTSKMMLGLQTLIAENYFEIPAKIVCIHTGGLR